MWIIRFSTIYFFKNVNSIQMLNLYLTIIIIIGNKIKTVKSKRSGRTSINFVLLTSISSMLFKVSSSHKIIDLFTASLMRLQLL